MSALHDIVDTLGFVDAVAGLPEQAAQAHRDAARLDLSRLPGPDAVANIVVCGMGGSGISGDVLQVVASPTLPVPVIVLKQIRVPAFVDARSLVFAVSYSGGTDETLQMAQGALDAGAFVVAVSTGGELARRVVAGGGLHVPCPPGYMPRAALGALAVPMIVALHRRGYLDAHSSLQAAEAQLRARRDACLPAIAAPRNPARELARRIGRTIPLVYGTGALGGVAAMRWKADINENAKAPAFWNQYPELDHNEICGWGQHGDVTRQLISLVELRHDHEHESLDARVGATREIIEEALHQVLEVRAEGDGRLAQLLDLMYLGDWVSLYLALDAGVDPGPIDAIATLKSRMSV
jgi:glucose/mannose-6-phosphate isomerase